ncbi:deoxyribose-phosphate aldolase [Corynebacterium sp. HMSC078H07]|uniref:deoxyribose-phosphate aldolase n=1 Tax=Corynebacterium sp. HMSC078H07 TaxID=1739379 RepID=UPI0008A66602|nr:deoxyribose-phosphate aldolase [Corynebacterium sp. HMSC078H07]OFR62771.1 2-deoxyribose-5-phosphate aldolase [Corynebacterium sp. HMSC078H07]
MTSRTDVAQMIDHTLLKPEATPDQVAALAKEAGELGTYSICVSPNQLPVEVPAGVHVATVVGFPSGAVKTEVKAAETARAVKDGAEEIDMVVNLSQVKSHDYAAVEADIKAVRDAAPAPVIVKVIIESAALDDEEIVATCQAAERAGADFVKTSTGFHPAGGASVHAVKLLADTVEGRLGVKASGGIRDAEAAQAMIDAGATRLGLSSSAAVLEGFEA